jgi:copper chaperone CopZ
MKRFNITLLSTFLLVFTPGQAQVRNAVAVRVAVDGNCGMCKKTIEAAALIKREAMAEWDVDAKMATITYDSTRTDVDAVLKRIALAGYDNERYLAPADAYAALPGCCQYERTRKHPVVHEGAMHTADAPMVPQEATTPAHGLQTNDPLEPVFSRYFLLKDALVASDAAAATTQAAAMKQAMAEVKMDALAHDVHVIWMDVMKPLADQVDAIASAKDLEGQRKAFAELTEPLEQLVKAAPRATPVHVVHCPMYAGGADWLSLEKPVKNPFYGNKMLTCGSVTETIAK